MKKSIKIILFALAISIFASGCAQKVRIKALNPAEVGAMASKKRVAVSKFRKDTLGLSGKIEAEISKQTLDKKRYFTVLSRNDMNKIISEQNLQSSEVMDEKTSAKIGKLIGAQAIVGGEVVSSQAQTGSYLDNRKECVSYNKDGCASYRYYKVTCNTIKATVSANINILNVENGTIIYGDTISKEYDADSCKYSSGKVLSKAQALNRLASSIANEFVYKLTPNYIYFSVTLLEKIKLETATDKQHKNFERALAYIKAARYDKSMKILEKLMEELDGKSYVVAYVDGVVLEATGDFDKAKKLYAIADDVTIEPIEEINLAINRIDRLIEKREEAKKQMNSI